MNITFGICLAPNYNREYAQNLINSILAQNFDTDNFEIILVGDYKNDLTLSDEVRVIQFDESIKKGWITRKKNLIAQHAQYETLCIMHDYYLLDKNWYQGFVKYSMINRSWKILMNPVYRFEGDRHSDWLINQKYMDQLFKEYPDVRYELMDIAPSENGPRWVCGLPYGENTLSEIQYISGGYILCKREVLRDVPMNENLVWGDAEDIQWSESVLAYGYKFNFNPYSIATLQKPGKWKLYIMSWNCVKLLKEMFLDGD